jgi:hypothetical protein
MLLVALQLQDYPEPLEMMRRQEQEKRLRTISTA